MTWSGRSPCLTFTDFCCMFPSVAVAGFRFIDDELFPALWFGTWIRRWSTLSRLSRFRGGMFSSLVAAMWIRRAGNLWARKPLMYILFTGGQVARGAWFDPRLFLMNILREGAERKISKFSFHFGNVFIFVSKPCTVFPA